jgi:hypothetical protein
MKPRSRLILIIGGIVGASLFAFCFGLVLTILVIAPAREGGAVLYQATGGATIVASPSVGVGPMVLRTPVVPSPTPTFSIILATSTPRDVVSSPSPSVSASPEQQATRAPTPTPTPRFPFFYVQGSRVEQENCVSQYLKGLVVDAHDVGLNGVTVRYERWGVSEFYLTGSDPTAPQGHWTFDYRPGNRNMATDFILEVVESEANPAPLSEPLVIHYAGCSATGQITNIVFKQR